MKRLGLAAGDVVEIEGKRKTAAVVWPSYAEDKGACVIRMDRWTRESAGVTVGEVVRVRKAKAEKAVVVRPVPASTKITVDENFVAYVKKRLLNRPVMEGDTVPVPVLGKMIPFTVATTRPSGIVIVAESTHLIILGEPSIIKLLMVSPASVKLGRKVAVAGLMRSSLPEDRVELAYRRPSGSWVKRQVEVDEEGIFTDTMIADEAGLWVVRARVPGIEERSEVYTLILVEE